LANIKSQIKRNKQNEKRRLRNRMYRGVTRAAVRDARSTLEDGNVEESRTAVIEAISALDKAVAKGVIHKNNASRRKSRLMKRLASLDNEA
jgi:small subunit ribosomal protein S20